MLLAESIAARGLREVVASRRQLGALEAALVVEARRQGASWREIGELLGITPQSAWRRFRPLDPNLPRPRTVFDDVRDFYAGLPAEPPARVDGVRDESGTVSPS